MARRIRGAAILALLLLLSACHSDAERAQGNEALYDRLMSAEAYPAARFAILKAIKYQPDEPRLWLKLAQAEGALTNYNGAFAAYQHVADLQPDNVEALENLAVLGVRGGDMEAAKRYVGPLLLLQPDNISGQLVQGAIAISEHRNGDAERIADKMIAANSMREEAYLLKASALEKSGHLPDAAALMESRARLNPLNAEILIQLLQYRRALGQRDAIQDISIQLAHLRPENPVYVIESARAFHARGRDDMARAALDGLRQQYGASAPVMKAIAGYWRDMATPAVAQREIAALAKDATPAVQTTLADMLISVGDPAAAFALTSPLLRGDIRSQNIELATINAHALLDTGRSQEAGVLLDRILAFDGTNTNALLLRARLRMKANQLADALNDAQVAAAGDLGSEEAQRLVAQIYTLQGNKPLAGLAYAGLQRHFPNSVTAMQANTGWLLSQGRKAQALDVATGFMRAHPSMSAARAAYVSICKVTSDGPCNAETAIHPRNLF